jgi:hypothetical protein
MSEADKFTTEEWQTLQFCPLWAHTQVANIDGKIDEAENEVLAKAHS